MSRGENLIYSPTIRGLLFGIVISVKISSVLMTFCPGPRKNSSMDTVRSPAALAIFAVALSAIRLGATSADGVALAMLPPMVARFLIWIDPTSAALWARKGYFFLIT